MSPIVGAVDEDVAAVDLAGDARHTVDQVDDDAVLGDDDVLDAGGTGEVGVGLHVPELAVHRQHVARPDDVVGVEELAGAGVAGDVHQRVALVHDLGPQPGEAVDHPVDGVLVARGSGELARMTVSPSSMCTKLWLRWAIRLSADIGSPWRPGGDQHLTLGREVGEVLGVDQHVGRDVEVAEVPGDRPCCGPSSGRRTRPCGRARTAASSTCCTRCTWEAKQATMIRWSLPAKTLVEDRRDLLLGGGEAGDLGVGGVGQEEVDALLPQPRERPQVGDPAVERELVHLEVAGVQHQCRRRCGSRRPARRGSSG